MRIAQINMTAIGSTGKIMLQIAETARSQGHIAQTFSTNQFSTKYKKLPPAPYGHTYYGSYFENGIHLALALITGKNGCYSSIGTCQLIAKLKKFKPDIIHLHNLHGFCINLPMLFDYIKSNNIKTVWTLHDCWSFTGHCPYFTIVNCDKWKQQCYDCPQINVYPKSRVDNSRQMYQLKKKWFTGVSDMTLVTPSQWLSELVSESFLQKYPVNVINNGIDLNIFKPTDSNFRQKHGLEGKHVILGVAFGWGKRKGLDVFLELSKRLSDDYRIVLVGTNDTVERELPDNIVSIQRTNNQTELAEIYSSADLFVNPTREENYPTVNMEAIACGTPVLTFKTGGSPEIVDADCGSIVDCNDIDSMEKEIIRICTNKPYSKKACLLKAKSFDMNDKFKEYIDLYENLTHRA
ncbi:MAG: glycosyltransferase [Clostridia bacterium]|nr:glycosyltransferase [Clostridia bacterium]